MEISIPNLPGTDQEKEAMDYISFGRGGASEVIEKKSRFIGEAARVRTKDEAESLLSDIKKRYYDARHHCFAYITGEPGSADEVIRSSDDGEPQGTAGRPLLDILSGRGLHQSLLVVTRYFGGTLLGCGGLSRAYSEAGQRAADDAGIIRTKSGILVRLSCGYDMYGKLEYYFEKADIRKNHSDFGEKVALELVISPMMLDKVKSDIMDITDGKCEYKEDGTFSYEEEM